MAIAIAKTMFIVLTLRSCSHRHKYEYEFGFWFTSECFAIKTTIFHCIINNSTKYLPLPLIKKSPCALSLTDSM